MENYELLYKVGSGAFGVTYKARNERGAEFAIKCVPRGEFINDHVKSGILNHRVLHHPNIIEFKEVVLDDTKLGIVMEYANGGVLFDEVQLNGAFTESKARKLFQELIAGVSYIHSKQICHRNLKLENSLLTANRSLKIGGFGFSKSLSRSKARSTIGTPSYWAPEVRSGKEYDGKLADVWSCGVILYVMLMRQFPPPEGSDLQKIAAPCKVSRTVSKDCEDLLSRILVADPAKRYTIGEIQKHPWYLKNLPQNLAEEAQVICKNDIVTLPRQSEEEINKIIEAARRVPMEIDVIEEAETSTSARGEDRFGEKNGDIVEKTSTSARGEDGFGEKMKIEKIKK